MTALTRTLVAVCAIVLCAMVAKPTTIPVILPLTGSGAFLGKQEQASFEIAQKFLNGRGDQVRFAYYDDTSSPQVAVQLATQLFNGGARVLLGPSLRATCAPLVPIVKSGPLDYCLSPTLHGDAGSFVFSAGTDTWDLDRAVVRYAQARGWKHVGLLSTTDASGIDAVKGYHTILDEPEFHDMSIVAEATLGPSDISVVAQLARIKTANPDMVLAWASGTPVATIFRGLREVGLNVPVFTGFSNMTYTQMESVAGYLPKQLYFPVPSAVGSRRLRGLNLDRKVETALRDFESAFAAAGRKPDGGDLSAWDPIMLVVRAIDQAGPDATSEQLRNYLAHLKNFAGINGVYDFEKYPQRGLGPESAMITQWNPDVKTWVVVSRPGGKPFG